MQTTIIPEKVKLRLPPVALEDLGEPAKDFLLAKANARGMTPLQALKDTLEKAATRAGFGVQRKA